MVPDSDEYGFVGFGTHEFGLGQVGGIPFVVHVTVGAVDVAPAGDLDHHFIAGKIYFGLLHGWVSDIIGKGTSPYVFATDLCAQYAHKWNRKRIVADS